MEVLDPSYLYIIIIILDLNLFEKEPQSIWCHQRVQRQQSRIEEIALKVQILCMYVYDYLYGG